MCPGNSRSNGGYFPILFDSGLVPADWRVANASPIFRHGRGEKIVNYRPVSLTLVLGKLQESNFKYFITRHLEGSAIIRQSQHGFRKDKS